MGGSGGGAGAKAFRVGAGVGTGGLSELAYYGPQGAARRAAEAAQNAAMAQQEAAAQQQAQIRGLTEGVTVEGLAQYDKALAVQDRNLARQEALVASIDPTILEASQQALSLLRGEQSKTLQPFQNQRALQRQTLVNSLREQLGPGAETSSAGQQALTRFDSESSNLFAGAQQQALGNLGNIGAQFSGFRPDMLQGAMGLGNLATNRAGLRFNQAGAMAGVNQNVLQSSGAQYTGDALRAQGQQALYGQLTSLGGQIAGTALGGYMTGLGSTAAQKPAAQKPAVVKE